MNLDWLTAAAAAWIALTAAGTWWIWVGARDPIEEANEALRRRRRP